VPGRQFQNFGRCLLRGLNRKRLQSRQKTVNLIERDSLAAAGPSYITVSSQVPVGNHAERIPYNQQVLELAQMPTPSHVFSR
jgi:hypothetical protein